MWRSFLLQDLGEIVGGATPSTNNEDYYGGNIPWITPKDLSTHIERYISKGERNITKLGFESCSTTILPEGSVLFSSRAPIGYIAIAKNDLCTNQGFKSIIPNKNVDSMFLYYLLKFNKEKIEASGSGTTFKEVSGTVMKKIQVNLPPFPEQRAIAATLSCLDEKIELNNKINANSEAQAQAIFKSWFVDFEPWDGVMPDDWREGCLADVCDYCSDKVPVSALSLNTYISTENMLPNKTGFVNATNLPTTLQTTSFKDGDILISNIRPYFKKIIYCDFDGGCSTDVLCFRASQQYASLFLYCALYSDRFFDYMVAGSKGTKMPRGDKQQVMKYALVIPNAEALSEFSSVISPFMKNKSLLAAESRTLAAIRDALLPKLMSGEIEVSMEDAR